ncbi:hypothetical protein ACJRO7_034243 [Eucalyptus globulus]|uniref:FBD domain-containing protein n=1 Tax=Eucalyptus globulus TaxID=34317 RepID=A0ABD3J8G7_EUCGL
MLCFDLTISYKSLIDQWIRFVLTKRVKVLQLNFWPASFEDLRSDCDPSLLPYLLGQETLIDANAGCSQRVSGLSNFGLNPSSSWHVGLRYLEELTLCRVTVEGELIEQLLVNCPILELRVSGQSLKLKYLFIGWCDDLECVEIYDTDLVSFTFEGMKTRLRLYKLPYLSEVSITGYIWELVGENLPIRQLLKLTSVKQLKLTVDGSTNASLFTLVVMVKACPYLQSFGLELMDPWWMPQRQRRELKRVVRPLPLHRYLKKVEFYNYYGRHSHLELVTCLIASAVALEKLVVNTCDKEYVSGEWKKLEEPREWALQQFKGKIPLKIALVIN